MITVDLLPKQKCTKCKKIKSIGCFCKTNSKSGLNCICKSCFKIYKKDYEEGGKEYYYKNRTQIIEKRRKFREGNKEYSNALSNAHKRNNKAISRKFLLEIKSNPCFDCNKTYPPYAMDFDHRDGSLKSKNVGRLIQEGYSLKTIKKEIEKCDLVCTNCHRERTFNTKDIRKNNHKSMDYIKYGLQKRINNSKILNDFKYKKPCMDCKTVYPSYIMDLDHRNMEEKLFTIGTSIGNVSQETLIKEMDKCDIVCANCHRIRTHKQLKEIQNRK